MIAILSTCIINITNFILKENVNLMILNNNYFYEVNTLLKITSISKIYPK